MLRNLVNYLSKISIKTHAIGTILFFSIVGFIPLFGYAISAAQNSIHSDSDFKPPTFSPFLDTILKGIIGLTFILLLTLPSGLIYVLMPILLDNLDITNMFSGIFALVIAGIGLILSLGGFYIFTAVIFSYCKFTIENETQFKLILSDVLRRKIFSKEYFFVVIYISIASLIFGVLTNLLLLSVILSPLVGPVAVFYFSTIGYLIGKVGDTTDNKADNLTSKIDTVTN